MSSGVIGAQYGSTKAQNRFGVSFLGTVGFEVSEIGRICSFCNGSNEGAAFSVLSFGMPTTLTESESFEFGNVFSFLTDRLSLAFRLRLPGDPGT